jgi:DDE superfamily endonuclease
VPSTTCQRSRDTSTTKMEGGIDDDEEEELEYGYRDTRNRTSHQHRVSSSLTPAQIMEQENMYDHLTIAHNMGMYGLQLLILINERCRHLLFIISEYSSVGGAVVARYIESIQAHIQHLNYSRDIIFLVIWWIIGFGELALLRFEDLSIYVRRRNRFQPKRNRSIAEINDQDCYSWFGQSVENMEHLMVCLRIQEEFVHSTTRTRYTGEECFLVWLFHLKRGMYFTDMARLVFGGDPRRLSEMNDLFITFAYNKFYNKISGTSLDQWLPRYLDLCRELIWNALSSDAIEEIVLIDDNGQRIADIRWYLHHFEFDSFRIFGFLDDFAMPTARPGNSATRRYGFLDDIQRAFYSGYLRRHGLKAQVVLLPIGIVGSIFLAELRQNDNGVLNMSNLNQYLLWLLRGNFIRQLFPCLYCDGIFALLDTILPRFTNPSPEQQLLNLKLASPRQSIEHVLGDHRNHFKLFTVHSYLRLFNYGVKVRQQCLISFFMLNCYYCLDGTRCRFFGYRGITLQDYLPEDEELLPPLQSFWETYGILQCMVLN